MIYTQSEYNRIQTFFVKKIIFIKNYNFIQFFVNNKYILKNYNHIVNFFFLENYKHIGVNPFHFEVELPVRGLWTYGPMDWWWCESCPVPTAGWFSSWKRGGCP